MYRGVLAHRAGLLAADGPLRPLGSVRARVLVRPSQQYAAALHTLADARFQQDGRRWGCALEALNRRYKFSLTAPRTWAFVAAEREALERLDLPSFWMHAGGTDVMSEDRSVAPAYFRESGLQAVESLIHDLSEDDLARQLPLVRRAVSQSTRSRFSTPLVIPAGESGVQDHRAALVATAEWIARELASRGSEVTPGTLETARLYDGSAGPALFFAALAAITGDARWREQAAAAGAALTTGDWRQTDAVATGATVGIGSLVYALTLISRLTKDPQYLDAAQRFADRLTDEVLAADAASDVSSGIAGALLAFLALNGTRADAALIARAQQCGRLLRARQVHAGDGAAWTAHDASPRAGFAHGAAGIAYALGRLFEVTRDPALPPAIAAAHDFERGLFSPADRNWPSAGAHAEQGAMLMTAWCNGAPGIGLARAFASTVFEDETLAGEVGVAVEAAARLGAAQADHLCCGNMGRADVLFTIGQLLPSRNPMQIGMQIAGSVVARARERGHFRLSASGAEYEVFTPGFFTGLSGIGYTLLRFAEPQRLPSVLAFGI
jgi:type 2 lantibiotic biosynthesis protein LanM